MKWKLRLRRRRAVAVAIAVCVLIVAVPTAVAQTGYQDLRSPDARDAALAAGNPARASTPELSGMPSPAAAQALARESSAAQPAPTYRDLRSPDARDAARGITPGSVPAPVAVPVERRTVVSVEEASDQTLAIVFSASALLIALMSVGFVAVARRPRARWTAS